jgi:imidazolonepropionase-like amidohydrolase
VAVGRRGICFATCRGLLADAVLLDVPSHTHLGYRMGGDPVEAVYKAGERVV